VVHAAVPRHPCLSQEPSSISAWLLFENRASNLAWPLFCAVHEGRLARLSSGAGSAAAFSCPLAWPESGAHWRPPPHVRPSHGQGAHGLRARLGAHAARCRRAPDSSTAQTAPARGDICPQEAEAAGVGLAGVVFPARGKNPCPLRRTGQRRRVASAGEVTDRATSPRGTARVASPACACGGVERIPHARTAAVLRPQLRELPRLPSRLRTPLFYNCPLNFVNLVISVHSRSKHRGK
jgi:hypothetical protein